MRFASELGGARGRPCEVSRFFTKIATLGNQNLRVVKTIQATSLPPFPSESDYSRTRKWVHDESPGVHAPPPTTLRLPVPNRRMRRRNVRLCDRTHSTAGSRHDSMFKRDLRGASRTRLASGSWFLDRCGEGRGEDGMPFTPEVCDRVRADICLQTSCFARGGV